MSVCSLRRMHFLSEVEPLAVFDKPFVPNFPEMLSDEFAQWKGEERMCQSTDNADYFNVWIAA